MSREQLAHGRVRRDLLVHQRLRERRLVAFVVAVAPVADQVDQEVAPEARAVFPGQTRRLEAGDRIVGVDVDDRNLEAARQAARVAGAVGLARRGGEAELVVGDDVNRAVGVVAGQPRQVERLGDDALARETPRRRESGSAACWRRRSRVRPARLRDVPAARAMPTTTGFTASRWLGFGASVTNICPRGADGARAGVILHVAHPAEIDPQRLRGDRILELGQDLRVRLLQHVREHVQPAAMRHADHACAACRCRPRRR